IPSCLLTYPGQAVRPTSPLFPWRWCEAIAGRTQRAAIPSAFPCKIAGPSVHDSPCPRKRTLLHFSPFTTCPATSRHGGREPEGPEARSAAMDATSTLRPFSFSRQRWFILGLLLFFLSLSVQYSLKVLHSDRDNRSAILRWRDQIHELWQGANIYLTYNYPNPPIMALLLSPLVELPPLPASLCWYYLKVLMTLLAFYWAFRLVEEDGRPFPAWGKALTVLLALRPIVGDLTHGNVNLFILFLIVASLEAYRQRRDVLRGLLLALAIACTRTPALFV